jgi:putative ABC transport system substrate-binding protein
MKRRTFIAGLGSAAAWPLAARAQPALPVVGFVDAGSTESSAGHVAAFREGLGETGYVEGQNVAVEYHWLEGQFERLPALMGGLVRRRIQSGRLCPTGAKWEIDLMGHRGPFRLLATLM